MRTRILPVGAIIVLSITLGVAAPANAAVVGLCRITVGEPHGSHHVAGMINSYGRLQCSIDMPEIYVRTTLEKSSGAIWRGNPESWLSAPAYRTYSSIRAIPCAGNAGTYRTKVAISFTSPPGINPAYHAKTYTSIWRAVPPCAASRVAPSGTTDLTLEFRTDGTIRELAAHGTRWSDGSWRTRSSDP